MFEIPPVVFAASEARRVSPGAVPRSPGTPALRSESSDVPAALQPPLHPPTSPLLNRTDGGMKPTTGPRIKCYKPAAGRRGEGRQQQAVVFFYGTILGSVLSLNIYAKLLPALRGQRGRWSLQQHQLYQGLDRDELPVGPSVM